MKYIILPGFSEKNREWAYELSEELTSNRVETTVIEWDHWKSKVEADFDFAREGEKVIREIGDSKVGVIAKSIGTVLFTRLLKSIPDKIVKVVLMGIPVKSLTENDRENFSELKNFPTEDIKIFQNSQDPYGSFKEAREFIGGINQKIDLTILMRDDHNYPFNEILLKFVKED